MATVDSNGTVYGHLAGTAVITATAADGSGKSASCYVTVTENIPVTSIEVSPSDTTLKIGHSIYPSVTVCPTDATNKSVTWSSADSHIASVNPNSGLVYAHAVGTTTIYATACDGSGVCGCCTVRVIPVYVQDVVVCPGTLTLDVGESSCLEATVSPVNATNPNISWTSGDCNIADVDSNGCVTAKASGTTIIYATAQDGSGVCGCCCVTVTIGMITVDALKTTSDCYVRVDMIADNTTNDTRLRTAVGDCVILRKNSEDTVQLLQKTKIIGGEYNSHGNTRTDWYQILYDGMMTYVTADSFDVSNMSVESPPSGRYVRVNTGNGTGLPVRSSPKANGIELGKFEDGIKIKLTNETPQNKEWYAVYGCTDNGTYTYGWCCGDYLIKNAEGIEEEEVAGLIATRECYVRSATTTADSNNILKKTDGSNVILKINDTVRLLQTGTIIGTEYTSNNASRNDWYEIAFNNTTAYVTADSFEPFTLWKSKKEITDVYNISENGILMLKGWEKFRSEAYIASSNESNYTIGYGHVILDGTTSVTIDGVSYPQINREQASRLLNQDLNVKFISMFNDFLISNNIQLNQKQYDACILDCYQRGENIWKKQNKKIAKFILANENFQDYDKVLNAFLGDGSNAGKNDRRTKEANLFVYGVYHVKKENI